MEDYQELIRKLTLAENRIDGLYYQTARMLGIKDNTLAILYALDDGQPHSQKQLCEEWLIPKTTINTIVKELSAGGYLTLHIEAHTREKKISLTAKGRKYAAAKLEKLYRMEQEAMQETLAEHGPAFIQAFADFAENLKKSFEKYFSSI
ncbi:MAG TPA: MarR family transcriptional regulator [Candidatus Eisenbergiella merdipullorum]|uniref:MarR family transcriptional regulator n=1 Tax=Candidatus Eisenbergiella merdipullorum TaxID=2838553 RepID=A0A9D2I9T8_9FIRM|nr:MarR family transcriptional regulator [Candidatus Eisenbergiella merdipullorum]